MFTRRIVLTGLLILVGCMAPNSARGQAVEESPVVNELTKRLSGFFEALLDRRAATAYADLLVGSPLSRADRQSQREQLIKKTEDLEAAYGRPRGYERISARRVGADVVQFKYLYKCENYPIAWQITYYRGSRTTDDGFDAWRVIAVKFDTDLTVLER